MFSELKCKAYVNLSSSHEQGAIKKVGGLGIVSKMLELLGYACGTSDTTVLLSRSSGINQSSESPCKPFWSEYSMYQIYVQLATVAITVLQAHQHLTQVSLSSTSA